jgi:SAM-dependent methyltransferase
MTAVEQRTEAVRYHEPTYATRVLDEDAIAKGVHRTWVGGKWNTHGKRQVDFLLGHGLTPATRFLDVGCGSLRAGRHLVDHLDAGNYFGIDVNQSVVQAGYDVELNDAQRAKLPIGNLRATDRFDVDFGVTFDMAIAQSLFTHISLNNIRLCLYRVAKVVRPGGVFFVTFFEEPPSTPIDAILPTRGKSKYHERNIFWYHRRDIRWAARCAPWEWRYIGKWGHPVDQRMVALTRLPDA